MLKIHSPGTLVQLVKSKCMKNREGLQNLTLRQNWQATWSILAFQKSLVCILQLFIKKMLTLIYWSKTLKKITPVFIEIPNH